jgi:hypothetical protein
MKKNVLVPKALVNWLVLYRFVPFIFFRISWHFFKLSLRIQFHNFKENINISLASTICQYYIFFTSWISN